MAEDPDRPASIAHIWAQAAHDLRQPVQAALLLAGGLDSTAEPAQLQRTANHLDGSLRCLDDMLEILILLSRIEAGLQMATPRPCELADLLQPILQETTAIAAERGQPLRFEGLEGMVRSHPRLLATAVRSLVINAIDCADGEAINLACRRHGDTLRLEAGFASAHTGRKAPSAPLSSLRRRARAPLTACSGWVRFCWGHACRLLGDAFEDDRPSPGRRQLALVLSVSATSR